MKISSYYKEKGFEVEWYSPLFHESYTEIFVSKIFNYKSRWDPYLRKDMIIGGTGFDLNSRLPEEIEHCYPDYSLYGIEYAMGFLTRGCIRDCPFCIVRKKEGDIHKNSSLEEFCKDQEKVQLLDNNFLAYTHHIDELKILKDSGKKIDFNQGLDIRLINEKNAKLLSEIKKWDGVDIRFAFDDVSLENIIRKKTEILKKVGIKRARFYVLVGYNSTREQDFRRINVLKELDHRIYIMPYDKTDPFQKALRKFCNKFFYMKMDFDSFLKNYGTIEQRKQIKSLEFGEV